MNAFALAELSENIYITLPPMYGHEKTSRMDLSLKLNKSLYGLVKSL